MGTAARGHASPTGSPIRPLPLAGVHRRGRVRAPGDARRRAPSDRDTSTARSCPAPGPCAMRDRRPGGQGAGRDRRDLAEAAGRQGRGEDVGSLLAGEFMGDFGGFLSRDLRVSDFALGYQSSLAWLRRGLGECGLDEEICGGRWSSWKTSAATARGGASGEPSSRTCRSPTGWSSCAWPPTPPACSAPGLRPAVADPGRPWPRDRADAGAPARGQRLDGSALPFRARHWHREKSRRAAVLFMTDEVAQLLRTHRVGASGGTLPSQVRVFPLPGGTSAGSAGAPAAGRMAGALVRRPDPNHPGDPSPLTPPES